MRIDVTTLVVEAGVVLAACLLVGWLVGAGAIIGITVGFALGSFLTWFETKRARRQSL